MSLIESCEDWLLNTAESARFFVNVRLWLLCGHPAWQHTVSKNVSKPVKNGPTTIIWAAPQHE